MRVDMISGGHSMKKRLMKFENVIESDDDNNVTQFNYRVLRDNQLSDGEIDQLMSKLLIDNLNNVINTVNENLQATGQKNNLVKIIDYKTTNIRNLEDGGIISNGGGLIYSTNTKKKNKHENQIHKNEDNIGSQNLNELNIPVRTNSFENADVKASNLDPLDADLDHLKSSYPYDGNIDELKKKRLSFFYQGAGNSAETANSNSFCSDPDLEEIGTLITTGSAYKETFDGESLLIPRFSAVPRTESMEVHSTTSEQAEEEFDVMEEDMYSDDDELSLVDSLDDFTMRMNRISKMQSEQERQANNFYKTTQNSLKAEAYFVPLKDTEKQLDEHFSLHMPESLRYKLNQRQKHREFRRLNIHKNKQWRMASMDRRVSEILLSEKDDFSSGGGGSFKVIPIPDEFSPKKLMPLRRPPPVARKIQFKPDPPGSFTGGWRPKARDSQPIGFKGPKSKKLRDEIGMLESYTIDGRGMMKKQLPRVKVDPKIRRNIEAKRFVGLRNRPLIPPSSQIKIKPALKSVSTVNSLGNLQPIQSSASGTSSKSTERFFEPVVLDGRKKQIMKDGKNDLTPDPESGPIRKMWKTEFKEGDKHIEILEIIECENGNSNLNTQLTPTTNNDTQPPNPKPSSQSQPTHFIHINQHDSNIVSDTTIVINDNNNDISENIIDTDECVSKKSNTHFSSRIPVPITKRLSRAKYTPTPNINILKTSDNNNNSHQSNSSDSPKPPNDIFPQLLISDSKVDRLIADLLLNALQIPQNFNFQFIKSPKSVKSKNIKNQSLTLNLCEPDEIDETTLSLIRRPACHSAGGRYFQHFEAIPEEKSTYSLESSIIVMEKEEHENFVNINLEESLNQSTTDSDSTISKDDNEEDTKDIKDQKDLENYDIRENHKSDSNCIDNNNNEIFINESFLPDKNINISSPKSVASRKSVVIPAKSPKILRKTSTEPRLKGLPSLTSTPISAKKKLQHTKSTSNLIGSPVVSFKKDVITFEDLGEEDSSDKINFNELTENFKVL
jgi:hypothetical protein